MTNFDIFAAIIVQEHNTHYSTDRLADSDLQGAVRDVRARSSRIAIHIGWYISLDYCYAVWSTKYMPGALIRFQFQLLPENIASQKLYFSILRYQEKKNGKNEKNIKCGNNRENH